MEPFLELEALVEMSLAPEGFLCSLDPAVERPRGTGVVLPEADGVLALLGQYRNYVRIG